MRRQRFVKDHEREHNVAKLCRLMEISRSGFYTSANNPPSMRSQKDSMLTAKITAIHERSRKTYGAPRIHGELKAIGTSVGCKRVARLMRQGSLIGAHSRKKWRRGKPNVASAPDLLKRNLLTGEINELLVADITEFTTDEGKLYLSGVKDLGSNAIVGWAWTIARQPNS